MSKNPEEYYILFENKSLKIIIQGNQQKRIEIIFLDKNFANVLNFKSFKLLMSMI